MITSYLFIKASKSLNANFVIKSMLIILPYNFTYPRFMMERNQINALSVMHAFKVRMLGIVTTNQFMRPRSHHQVRHGREGLVLP